MLRKLLNRSRRGKPYTGVVVYSSDPLLVPWPGHYGVKDNGEIDKHCLLEFVEVENVNYGKPGREDFVQHWRRA